MLSNYKKLEQFSTHSIILNKFHAKVVHIYAHEILMIMMIFVTQVYEEVSEDNAVRGTAHNEKDRSPRHTISTNNNHTTTAASVTAQNNQPADYDGKPTAFCNRSLCSIPTPSIAHTYKCVN